MSKPKITQAEFDDIARNEAEIAHLLENLEKAKRFNIGDYLIRFAGDSPKAEQNSYFVERRFQVAYTDKNGVCYIKEVIGGKTSSWIMPMISCSEAINSWRGAFKDDVYRYELDPLYEDHIIMQQEGLYDPGLVQSDKSKLHKEITAHNKAIKVKTYNNSLTLKFMKTIKLGDTYWFSNVTSFIVQEIKALPKSHTMPYDHLIFGVTNKGKKLKLSISDLTCKAVYTACPRSYRELKA